MLPSVASFRRTSTRILGYTLVLWALSVAFSPVAGMGHLYLGASIVLGGIFTWYALRLYRMGEGLGEGPAELALAGGGTEVRVRSVAMQTFAWSITYITLLFGAMAVDQLLRSGW
jgi:protoheme IX farnesyltransferase